MEELQVQRAAPSGSARRVRRDAQDAGQRPVLLLHGPSGITRGGHYHHTKTEKFLVIKGQARFGFRHIHTGETYELTTNGDDAEIVETVPGWTHDITNIGQDEMIVMLWANEIFDRANAGHVRRALSEYEETESHDGRRHPARDHSPVARDRRAGRALRSCAGPHRAELRL